MQATDDDDDTITAIDGQRISMAFLREAPDCVTILNDHGRISFLNENDRSALEIEDREEVVGLVWWDLWPERHRDALKSAFNLSLSGKIATYWGQAPDQNGEHIDWDVRMTPIPNADQTISSVLIVSRDVTPEPA